MKKYIVALLLLSKMAPAQELILPAPAQQQPFVLKNATVHLGNGAVMLNTSIRVEAGKIAEVGNQVNANLSDRVIDVSGKHIYPGLILAASNLGLVEIGSGTRGSNDVQEIGDHNYSVRAIAAYNADSKIINTVRSNGILLAQIIPQGGGLVSGSSSVVQLDAWNYEDAAYLMDNGIHVYLPNLLAAPPRNRFSIASEGNAGQRDAVKEGLDKVEDLKTFLKKAQAWAARKEMDTPSLGYNAVQGLFSQKQKLFVHANQVRQILVAISLKREFKLDVVIVGGAESYRIADLLKENEIPVILDQMHALPVSEDDDIDQAFKIPAALQKAGVLFCINDDDAQNRGRNLPFNAGTAVAYGLGKEEAISAITLNAARILGIDQRTGSIEVGKEANLVISEGDILDMRTSKISHAFIQGRPIDLNDHHKLLFERYKQKYQVK